MFYKFVIVFIVLLLLYLVEDLVVGRFLRGK